MWESECADHGLDVAMLIRFMKRHVHETKPVDAIDVKVSWAVPKGHNYASRVYRVKLQCLLASGKKRTVSLIVKAQLLSIGHQELFSAVPVFRTEIKTYTIVLRLMEDLQKEFDDRREPLWPQMFGFERYNMVVLEDLECLQYFVADRRKALDLRHALLVLRNIARFHALSKILLSRNLISRDDVNSVLPMGSRGEIAKAWLTAVLICLSDAMNKTWGTEWSRTATKLKAQMPVVTDKVADLAELYDKRFEVLNHGDLWTCNALFHYMEFDDIPVSVRFVDFQMCHVNSFIWDLEYFITSSVVPSVRRSEKHRLYKAYQQSLEKNLKFFGFSGYIPTLEDVMSEAQRLEYVAAILTMQSPITYAETDRAVATENILGHSPNGIIHESVYADGKAQASIGPDLEEFVSTGQSIGQDLIAVMLSERIRSGKPMKVLKFEKTSVVSDGENFASAILRVRVQCVLASGRKKWFSLIVKEEDLRVFTRDQSFYLFRQETHAYTRILSDMETVMDELNDQRDTLWPQFYGYVPYHTLVLEDLTQKGYATYDRRAMLGVEHVALVMRALGRFHAMTMVLRSRRMINTDHKGRNMMATDNRHIEQLFESGLIVLSDAVEENYGEEWLEVAAKLRKQIPILFNKLKSMNSTYDPKFEVLNHGDMWNNNVLFKHMEFTNTPVSVKFVDFQVMHLNSFIWDISHFVNTCMQPKILRDNRTVLMSAYQESLEHNLSLYGYQGYVPTLDDVLAECQRLLYAEFALRVIIRPIITFSLRENFDMKMLITKKPDEALNKSCFTDAKAMEGIKEDLLWFMEQKAI